MLWVSSGMWSILFVLSVRNFFLDIVIMRGKVWYIVKFIIISYLVMFVFIVIVL